MAGGSRRFMARRRLGSGIGFSRLKAATCAERMHAGIGASAAGHVHRLAFHAGDDFLQQALNGGKAGLHLPAVKRAAIVGEVNANAAHYAGREPGLTTGSALPAKGQSSGR